MSTLKENYKKVMQMNGTETDTMNVAALMTIAEELNNLNKTLIFSASLHAENLHTLNTWKNDKEGCEIAIESNLERFIDNINNTSC